MKHSARQLWQLAEPYHAVTYFSPDALGSFQELGLRGFWRGYFAGRAAPLGPVGPNVVTACFSAFEPRFVARALPAVWEIAEPSEVLDARLEGVDRALRRLCDISSAHEMTAASARIREALDGCSVVGRPVYAANLELQWPTEAHLALWHATTLLREHRGDGHVTALMMSGLDPCEAHLTQLAANDQPLDDIGSFRGWTQHDWDEATEHLRSRGWLDSTGHLTPVGHRGRKRVEDETDRLAMEPVRGLGMTGVEEVCRTLRPWVAALASRELIPYPNPMGVPAPTDSSIDRT